MKYKLYNEVEVAPLIHHILCGRGMAYDDVDTWLKAEKDQINNWTSLGEEIMTTAVDLVAKTILQNKSIMVIVDSDADGFTSSAIFINYLYKIAPEYVKKYVKYYLHSGKQQGNESNRYELRCDPCKAHCSGQRRKMR